MSDYIVIDLRKTKPLHLQGINSTFPLFGKNFSVATEPKDVPFSIYVVYKEDFSSYEVFDATLKPLGDRTALLS